MLIKKWPAGKFKAQCLKIMTQVKESKQPIIITKRNIPIVKIESVDKSETQIFGCLKGLVVKEGDLISPIGEAWNAAS